MENILELKTINELNQFFFIPSYQREYKWTHKEVEDLLNDIYAAVGVITNSHHSFTTRCR